VWVGPEGRAESYPCSVGWDPKVGHREIHGVWKVGPEEVHAVWVGPEGRTQRNPCVRGLKSIPTFALLLSREPLIDRACPLVVPRRKSR
jgi:hypothetical protein